MPTESHLYEGIPFEKYLVILYKDEPEDLNYLDCHWTIFGLSLNLAI
jgi:hypothetical protein